MIPSAWVGWTPPQGTNQSPFGSGDWLIAATVAALWGSSFLWIAVGLESLSPGVVAWARVALGATALWALPSARRPVGGEVWPTIAVIAVAGNAAPALLFAVAQQRVDSAVAAMINSATPLAVLVTGLVLGGRLPGERQTFGLVVGFVGVATIAAPSLQGASGEPWAVALLAVAVLGYGVSNNLIVGPQQRYGAAAVVARALTVSTILLAPVALLGRPGTVPAAGPVIAVAILGIGGTGAARALNAKLAGRTGAARGSITTYLVPVVAIALGVGLRGEMVRPIEVVGTGLVLAAAGLTSRGTG